MPTGKRIYEEVWSHAQILLQKTSKFLKLGKKDNLWWNDRDWESNLNRQKEKNGLLQPFVLKYVDRQGYSCSMCNWTQKCSGCIIEPVERERNPEFLKNCHIAIEWDSAMIEEDYNPTVNENLKHPSSEKVQLDDED